MRKIANLVVKLGSSCPYTIAGKRIAQSVLGRIRTEAYSENNKKRDVLAMKKLGRNIALIGIFCPFFWIALISGIRGRDLYFNAIHSGVVILLGLGIMAKSQFDIYREQ